MEEIFSTYKYKNVYKNHINILAKKYFGKSIRKAQKSPEQWENVNKCFPEEGTQKARDRGNLSVYYPSIYHLKDILSQLIVVRGIQFETGMRKFYTYFIGEKCK